MVTKELKFQVSFFSFLLCLEKFILRLLLRTKQQPQPQQKQQQQQQS